MKYMGSKNRISKYIVPIIQQYIDDNKIHTYVEPMCGGCNIIDKIKCNKKIASDKEEYLIYLLMHVKDGGELLPSVTKEMYDAARNQYYKRKPQTFENWEIGNIGFLASYNGRGFSGGYAKSGYENNKNGKRWRDYYKEASENLLSQAKDLQDVNFLILDYREFTPIPGVLYYVDPPYKNKKQYDSSKDFDYEEFWKVMREWSKTNIVIISEEDAPDDFECIWQQEVSRSIKAKDKSTATEKLFIHTNYTK